MIIDSNTEGPQNSPTDEEIELFVQSRAEEQISTFKIVKKNMDLAQEKQKLEYYNRKSKGVKTFNFVKGDTVLKRNSKNESRKGGKMEVKWFGPFIIVDIDSHKRVSLMNCKTKTLLKARCHWDQLKPVVRSDLHLSPSSNVSEPHVKNFIDSTPLVVVDDKNTIPDAPIVENVEQSQVPLSVINKFKLMAANKEWMTSDHVEYVQDMLKNMWSGAGLQTPLFFISKVQFHHVHAAPKDVPFIQILHKGGNHWIAISNVELSRNVVTIYDSGFTLLPYTDYDLDLLYCQICKMLNTDNDVIYVRFADVKQQIGGNDCGFFCAAFCTSLVFNEDPCGSDYIQDSMRSHIAQCAYTGVMSKFPVSTTNREHTGFLAEHVINVNCFCRMPARPNMIICHECFIQLHVDCIDYSYHSAGMFKLILLTRFIKISLIFIIEITSLSHFCIKSVVYLQVQNLVFNSSR